MADINFTSGLSPRAAGAAGDTPARHDQIVELIELLFFAYRDFVSDPDEILKEFGFGRAHHRVIHFVDRNPGLRVADLLDILRITKQSLGRVLKQLIDEKFVYQREGASDRRQRLLYLTERGRSLAVRLREPQIARVLEAVNSLDPAGQAQYRDFLFRMINPQDRDRVETLLARAGRDKTADTEA